jgi:hypothetical protein
MYCVVKDIETHQTYPFGDGLYIQPISGKIMGTVHGFGFTIYIHLPRTFVLGAWPEVRSRLQSYFC